MYQSGADGQRFDSSWCLRVWLGPAKQTIPDAADDASESSELLPRLANDLAWPRNG